MSTQHPDNVKSPFYSENSVLSGDDEIKEAFFAFSHISCREQLWDCEGKEVDNFVVKKLLNNYEPFFSKNKLGSDSFLTLRVPNPNVEKGDAKILLETLESIPRNSDIAKLFYSDDVAPIFEVTVPMTTSHMDIIRVSQYYKQYVVGKKNNSLVEGDIKISEWVGDIKPDEIVVTPLIEDKDSILNAHNIVEKYIEHEKIQDYQRVWFARSDPALNYSSLGNVLMVKYALMKLKELEEKTSIEILPIYGCGSAPFRGNFKPTNVKNMVEGYPSIQTFTLQSAFKYDYDISQVTKAVEYLNSTKRGDPIQVDEEKTKSIIEKVGQAYQTQIKLIANQINDMADYVPKRRKRKLHIGLFGYSRSVGEFKLPRAISFCSALYSYGLPPEIFGLDQLEETDLEYIRTIYKSFDQDLKDSLQYLNEDNLSIFPLEIQKVVNKVKTLVDFEVDEKHQKITSIILENFKGKNRKLIQENIERAGFMRGFLG